MGPYTSDEHSFVILGAIAHMKKPFANKMVVNESF